MRIGLILKKAVLIAGCLGFMTIMALWSMPAENFANLIVHPNPFQPSIGHESINFENVTEKTRLRVYKVTGGVVYDTLYASIDGRISWDAKDKYGKDLAAGIYIYIISSEKGGKVSGRIIIVR